MIGFCANGHGEVAAVGFDAQLCLERLASGAHAVGTDAGANLRFMGEMEVPGTAGIPERQPDAVAGDRAVEQAHTAVFQLQFKRPFLTGFQQPEVHIERIHAKFRLSQDAARQLGQHLIEATLHIGKPGGFLGSTRQIGSTEPAEETLQDSLLEQPTSGRPLLLTGQGQFVEVPAGTTIGKDKRTGEELDSDRDRAAEPIMAGKNKPVEPAIHRLGRVGTRTLGTELSHDCIPRTTRKGETAKRVLSLVVSLSPPSLSPCLFVRLQARTLSWTLPICTISLTASGRFCPG